MSLLNWPIYSSIVSTLVGSITKTAFIYGGVCTQTNTHPYMVCGFVNKHLRWFRILNSVLSVLFLFEFRVYSIHMVTWFAWLLLEMNCLGFCSMSSGLTRILRALSVCFMPIQHHVTSDVGRILAANKYLIQRHRHVVFLSVASVSNQASYACA